jgi:hypothetical protein
LSSTSGKCARNRYTETKRSTTRCCEETRVREFEEHQEEEKEEAEEKEQKKKKKRKKRRRKKKR